MTSEKEEPASEDGPVKVNLKTLMDVVKAVGFIGGGLGSLTILFFWIGNAIIVARLRVYNLYGAVHYTEEYVKEAGYQFFQDLFTFFTRWELGLLFLAALVLIFLLIPVGPHEKRDESSYGDAISEPTVSLQKIRKSWFGSLLTNKIWRYPLFAGLAVIAAGLLTSDLVPRNLTRNIIYQERLLNEAQQWLGEQPSLLFGSKQLQDFGGYKEIFYENLSYNIRPTRQFLQGVLADIYQTDVNAKNMKDYAVKFQTDFDIANDLNFLQEWRQFGQSSTYKILADIQVNQNLNRQLAQMVSQALDAVRSNLSGHLNRDVDVSTLVISPAIYEKVNEELTRLRNYVANVDYFFFSANDHTRETMDLLHKIRTIRFAGATLTFAFWTLVGQLIYLLLNGLRIVHFQRWEQVYFLFMALLFLIIAVAIPTTYGRYKFEFNVQKLESYSGEIADKLMPIKDGNDAASPPPMFILGPTRGKEVIIATPASSGSLEDSIRIMIVDKEAIKMQVLRPAGPLEIPRIIKMLRHGAAIDR